MAANRIDVERDKGADIEFKTPPSESRQHVGTSGTPTNAGSVIAPAVARNWKSGPRIVWTPTQGD